MSAGALERAIGRATARRSAAVERCAMCARQVPDDHRHVLDEQDGTVMCACRPCSLLFDRDAAGGGHFRLVPTARVRLSALDVDTLNVPVGLAFFVKQGDGRVLAHYPSPLGTTESEVDAPDWRAVEAQSPALAGMGPRIEALLVRTSTAPERRDDELWVLPVDECYRLVAVIRRHWTGMAGGSAVWREIARYFEDLRRPPGRRSGSEG